MKYFFALFLLLFYASTARAENEAEDLLVLQENTGNVVIPEIENIESREIVESVATIVSPTLEDSVAPRRQCATAFRPRQIVFPAVAIALGGAGIKTHLIDTSSDRERWTTIDDKLQYVPIVAYAGLGFIPGVRHNHNIGERFMAGATAYVVMTGICQGAKHLVGEPRPDTGADNSFPSGHTATAFCGAELCRLEYGNAYGAAAYAFAVTTGVMRVVNNRHWCNDVLAGAGIGFLSAHVGYWLLPYEKRLVGRIFPRTRQWGSRCCFVPTYQPETKAPSFAFAMNF